MEMDKYLPHLRPAYGWDTGRCNVGGRWFGVFRSKDLYGAAAISARAGQRAEEETV